MVLLLVKHIEDIFTVVLSRLQVLSLMQRRTLIPMPMSTTASSIEIMQKAPTLSLRYLLRSASRSAISTDESKRFSPSDVVLPTARMARRAASTDTTSGHNVIRAKFQERLASLKGPQVSIKNDVDRSSPSINFTFINECILGQDVFATDPGSIVGCGQTRGANGMRCSPHMGQHIGCEYSRICD
ncbi:hypothetical protein MRB53_037362 [Persea americana]|nr:hypothetical protein MRB53_037362 [Persea americana]